MKVSIVIRAFNEEKHLGKLLLGISSQDHSDIEVILVDSGSTDKTVAIAEKAGCKIVRIKPEEFSFGRSLNIGCKEASGEILVFASAHVYPVFNDWISKLLEPYKDEKVVLSYGRQCGDKVTKYSEHQIFRSSYPERSNWNQTITFCNNANCSVRRSAWEKIPYDEQLTGLEDLDWAKRAVEQGGRLAYVADAGVVHVHEEGASSILNRYRREAIALKNIYEDQRFTFLDFLRLLPTHLFNDSVCAIREGVFFKNFLEIILFRSLQMWGTFTGFRQKASVTDELKRKFYYPLNMLRVESKLNEDRQNRLINYARIGNE